jgi:hypothetical protein
MCREDRHERRAPRRRAIDPVTNPESAGTNPAAGRWLDRAAEASFRGVSPPTRPPEQRRLAVALFVAAWTGLALLLLPRHYVAGLGEPDPRALLRATVIAAADAYSWGAIALVAWWLAARLPLDGGARTRAVALHAAAGVSLVALRIGAWVTLGRLVLGLREPMSRASVLYFAPTYLLIYALLTGVGYALQYRRRLRARELAAAQREAELQAQLADARLRALRAQLHPHFLFNTLNAASALVDEAPRDARRVLARLGELLRLTLEFGDAQEVTLGRELAWLDRYVALQRVRFGDRLRVDRHVPTELLRLRVPCLVLQPLVENAIRHAVETRPGGGRVTLRAQCAGNTLRLTVGDDGPGSPATSPRARAADGGADDRGIGGIGLANTARRLAALYGPAATVRLTARASGGTDAVVELPARAQPDRDVEAPDDAPDDVAGDPAAALHARAGRG